MVEGIIQKSAKVLKYSHTLKLDGWDWLEGYSKEKNEKKKIKINKMINRKIRKKIKKKNLSMRLLKKMLNIFRILLVDVQF